MNRIARALAAQLIIAIAVVAIAFNMSGHARIRRRWSRSAAIRSRSDVAEAAAESLDSRQRQRSGGGFLGSYLDRASSKHARADGNLGHIESARLRMLRTRAASAGVR